MSRKTSSRHSQLILYCKRAIGLALLFTIAHLTFSSAAHANFPRLKPQDAAVRTAYFTTLPFRESPFADVIGIHPITATQAKTRNHYRFEYDAHGRPIRITFLLGDFPRPTNHTANFFFRTTRMDIRYEPGSEVRQFYDRFGNPALGRGVFKEIYEIDKSGYRRRLTFKNADASLAQSSWGVAEYRWRIEKDGTVIEDHYDLDGKAVIKRPYLTFYQLRLHYGPNGWLALMENYGPEGKGLINNTMNAAQDKLDYDANGDMRAWNVFDENEKPVKGNSPGVHKGARDFNELGYRVLSYYADEKGARMGSAYGWGESETRYDKFGNMSERWTGTPTGGPGINEILQYSGYIREWDKSGLLEMSRRYFLEDRKSPATHARNGAHKITYKYDDYGNRIRISHFDAQGKLVRSLDFTAAIIEYRYDKKNRLVERRLLDIHEALVNHEDGWAIEHFTYDEFGMRSSPTRFDNNLDPAPVQSDDE